MGEAGEFRLVGEVDSGEDSSNRSSFLIVIININWSFCEFPKAQCPALVSLCGPPSPRFLILSAHPAPYSLIESLRKDKAECDARLRQRDSNMVGRQPPIPPRLRVRVPQKPQSLYKINSIYILSYRREFTHIQPDIQHLDI